MMVTAYGGDERRRLADKYNPVEFIPSWSISACGKLGCISCGLRPFERFCR